MGVTILADHNVKESIIKRIQKSKVPKRTYQKLKFLQNKGDSSEITRILVHTYPAEDFKSCTKWIKNTTPSIMTKNILHQKKLHFNQVQGTPITIEPLKTQIDFIATILYCKCTLDGNAQSQGTPTN